MFMLDQLVFLSSIAFILTALQKIEKVTFFPRHYCAKFSPDQDYELIITLNHQMDFWDSSAIYPIQASLIQEKNPNLDEDSFINGEVRCSFQSKSSEQISCIFTMAPKTLSLPSISFYLDFLTISGQMIYLQSKDSNTTLELNSHYTEHLHIDAFQVLNFEKEKNNIFHMTFTDPVDLINSLNVNSITMTDVGGNQINVTEHCYSATINPSKPNTKVLCALNPRINNITNTFYSIQYTDVCGYQINTLITIQIKGVVIEYTENRTEAIEEWVNKCPLNQYSHIKDCYSECPSNTFYYNKTRQCLGKCSFKKLAQENDSCVKHCSKGFGLVNEYENKELIQKCIRCTNGYSLFETCYSICPIGSKVDKMGLSCQVGTESRDQEYENERSEDENEDNDDDSGINEPIETCEEYNPCEITGKCAIENNEKRCLCNDNYYGFYCEISEETMNESLALISKSLYVPNSDCLIDVFNPETRVQFSLINHLISQKNNFINEHLDFASYILKGTTKTLTLTNSFSQSLLKNPKGIGQLVNLNLKILLSMSKSPNSKRILGAKGNSTETLNSNVKAGMNELIDLINQYLFTHIQTMIAESIRIEYSINELISFMIWTDNVKSRGKAQRLSLKKGIAFGDFSICRPVISDNKINTYFSLELSPSIAPIIKEVTDFDTYLVYLKGMSYYGYSINLSDCPSIPIYFPVQDKAWLKLNVDKYTHYKEIGIDIYDQFDPAVNSLCFVTPKFDYDLPQGYRQYSLYENYTFISANNNKCIYKELNIKAKSILMLCGYSTEGFLGLFTESLLVTPFDKGNKPINCGTNIKTNFLKNCSFWIDLSLLLVFIFVQSLVAVYANKGVYIDDAHNENVDEKLDETPINTESDIDKTADNLDKSEDNTQKGMIINSTSTTSNQKDSSVMIFLKALRRNTLLHYPLVNIFIPSIMCPTHFKLAIFFFNIIALLGFNALYFHEGYIESRMVDLNRNSFTYNMSHEGLKMLLSLLSVASLMIIIRIISFVPRTTQETIKKRISGSIFCVERLAIYNDLLKMRFWRDIISYSFMSIMTLFLCYYSISFCSNYPNSAIGWVYSSLWTMILIWVVISPIYLVILSALANISYIERYMHIMKKIVFF